MYFNTSLIASVVQSMLDTIAWRYDANVKREASVV